MPSAQLEIGNLDLVIIISYLVGIVGLGCCAGFRQRRGAKASTIVLGDLDSLSF